ncbi:helix-turn-helix domain-containing protein [uncultured Megasphaera sp.]|uniref:helix-turn-helix domain-containing protein n=1 Tax=uncultured Megasphaera sp. TaxID=165188 RepID=UPI00266B7E12|nr:helix-turn-helix transcriptional regulator [uncultured Megasphaera sp.]
MRKYTDIFPIRLKALIQAYGFSLAETASILNLSSRSIVFEWENKKKFPSGENLNMISTVFGVSLDWLLGHSDISYSEESIKWTEEAIDEYLHALAAAFPNSLQGSFWDFYLHEHYPEYAFGERRSLYYSLPVRANIAVLIREVRLPSLYWSMYYAQNGFKKKGVIAKVKEFFHMSEEEAEEFRPPSRKELERGDNLVDLLTLNTINGKSVANKMPIYDVEAAYRQLQQEIPGTDE